MHIMWIVFRLVQIEIKDEAIQQLRSKNLNYYLHVKIIQVELLINYRYFTIMKQ